MEAKKKPPYPESDPRQQAANVSATLNELVRLLREDLRQFEEPKAQALFETAAEVLSGLRKAFDDYGKGTEPAMRER